MVKILDCTLRDGGYINDFNFGNPAIKKIISKLTEAQIEIVECGFLKSDVPDSDERSLFHNIESIKKFLPLNHHALYVAMIALGDCDIDIDDIEPCQSSSIGGIRLTFHQKEIEQAFSFAQRLMEKGYKVFIQPVGTTLYSDKEILSLIERVNVLNPYAFYLVDTLGVLYKNDLLRMFYLINNNLRSDIMIGFHSHNNLQLSFSNAQELILLNSKRDIVIDSSVYGMGRGAGNLCTELIAQYINENIQDRYDLMPILEIMDEIILPIYSHRTWGYSASYFIAAIKNCHPNYARYLMDKQTLCIKDINAIIKSIPIESRSVYREDIISDLYKRYLERYVYDDDVIKELSELCRGREILIFAPGKSLTTFEKEIQKYIDSVNPIIFSINHIPQKFRYDRIFISNLKRFRSIEDAVERLGDCLICTSNIVQSGQSIKIVNYTSYLNDNDLISDNSGLMLINILRKAGVKKMTLAGFDGFDVSVSNNYFDNKLGLGVRDEKYDALNDAIAEYFTRVRNNNIAVTFITPSIYDRK